jgi:pimeloyl-ACP methyl ester carboxylesterase
MSPRRSVDAAPTFQYRDWRDPEQVRLDDREKIAALQDIIQAVPIELGFPVLSQVEVFGFSRGAQLAARLAFFHPELIQGVVASAAGTYTLPKAHADNVPGDLAYPFGVADLSQYTGHAFETSSLRNVSFLVTVGNRDDRPADVPRQWDALLGSTRIERGRAFVQALTQANISAQFRIVANTDHEVSDGVRAQACEFLRSLTDSSVRLRPS